EPQAAVQRRNKAAQGMTRVSAVDAAGSLRIASGNAELWSSGSARQLLCTLGGGPTMTAKNSEAQPILNQRAKETQPFGTLTRYPLGLSDEARKTSVSGLNQLLADSITLRDMYKKHHWQLSGPTFYELHLLFDKHAGEQTEIVDAIAERVQTLGGIAL